MSEALVIDRLTIPPARARELVGQAEKVYLKNCVCRVREKNCPPETWEVCLHFKHAPPEDIADARIITTDEALSIVDRMAERRMMYNLFFTRDEQKVTELCSCCDCCCVPVRKLVEKGNYAEQLRSDYVVVTDEGLCAGCGLCLDECAFEARRLDNGTVQLVDERCFGCGRCVESCPEGAIRLAFQAGRGVAIPGDV